MIAALRFAALTLTAVLTVLAIHHLLTLPA